MGDVTHSYERQDSFPPTAPAPAVVEEEEEGDEDAPDAEDVCYDAFMCVT